MSDLMLLVVGLTVGLIPGLLATVVMARKVGVYHELWMNEKSGNYMMTKRLTELEERSEGE